MPLLPFFNDISFFSDVFFCRYWDAIAKQQQQKRKADEEIHRQHWAAYFEGQASTDGLQANASMDREIEEEAGDDARHCDPILEGVGVFGSIYYKDNDEKSS